MDKSDTFYIALKLSAPAQRALQEANIQTLADFENFTEAEVASWHGIGKNAMILIKEAMTLRQLIFKK
ncbi:hypothetical protein [Pedobacter punctiformis]|uniref:RNA polymerase alpha subunit C-terminal domain-containing protein n=1 Tax=Pedobacter punctiformis TaxID=3004097 RepID=A0ABT4LBR6_9SPHI|nr:hypothetical protein [Pedobacter sp. HCMS5-2]MCZ4245361.1 hypothetical protein [Pedobacter sp. HCMS5-2]